MTARAACMPPHAGLRASVRVLVRPGQSPAHVVYHVRKVGQRVLALAVWSMSFLDAHLEHIYAHNESIQSRISDHGVLTP